MGREKLKLLTTPPEDEWIAALQAHDAATGAGVLEHQLVNAFLRHGLRTGGLAHGNLLGIPPREREHRVGDQPIVKDHVRILQRAQCVQRQQSRITRARTDQHDGAASVVLGLIQQLRERLFGRVGLAAPQARSNRATHDGRVETSSRGKIRERELDALAPALQQSCQRAERFVEQAFQPLANVPGEHGGHAAARDRDHQRRAIDDRGHDEAGELGIVDDVDEDLPITCRRGDLGVHRGNAGGGDHQCSAVELRGVERKRPPVDGALAIASLTLVCRRRQALLEPFGQFGSDQFDARTRLQQQPHLALGDFSAADDEHALAAQVRKQWEIAHDPYPSSPCRPHSRFRPKKRVASTSPASASERVVCQSPIET